MPRKIAVSTASPDAVAHILATYNAATLEEWSDGRRWYHEAHALAAELAPADVALGAAVLAILSPRRAWPQNVTLARHAFATGLQLASEGASTDAREATWNAFPTTGDQRRKLARLFSGENPDTVVGGPKVRSFWQTITNPSDPDASAVIDRHAIAIAEDRPMASAELRINPATYAAYVDAYRTVSVMVGESPSVVQAITWVAWRRTRAVAFHGDIA